MLRKREVIEENGNRAPFYCFLEADLADFAEPAVGFLSREFVWLVIFLPTHV